MAHVTGFRRHSEFHRSDICSRKAQQYSQKPRADTGSIQRCTYGNHAVLVFHHYLYHLRREKDHCPEDLWNSVKHLTELDPRCMELIEGYYQKTRGQTNNLEDLEAQIHKEWHAAKDKKLSFREGSEFSVPFRPRLTEASSSRQSVTDFPTLRHLADHSRDNMDPTEDVNLYVAEAQERGRSRRSRSQSGKHESASTEHPNREAAENSVTDHPEGELRRSLRSLSVSVVNRPEATCMPAKTKKTLSMGRCF